MSFFKKNFVFKIWASSKGQATVEYILLLVVVMAIALGIGGPLGRHLKNFSGAIVGPDGYYACLTKAGRLPGDPIASSCGSYSALSLTYLGRISSGEDFSRGGGPGGGYGPGGYGPDGGYGPGGYGPDGGYGPGGYGPDGEYDTDGKYGSGGEYDTDGGYNSNGRQGDGSGRRGAPSRHRAGGANSDSSTVGSGFGSGGASSVEGSLEGSDTFPVHFKGKNSKKKKRQKRHKSYRAGGDELAGNLFGNKKKGYKRAKSKVRVNRGGAYLGDQIYGLEEEEDNQPVFKAQDQSKKARTGMGKESKNKNRVQDRKPTNQTKLDDEDQGFKFSGFLKYLVIAVMIVAIIIVIFSQVMEYQSRD